MMWAVIVFFSCAIEFQYGVSEMTLA